MASTSGKNQRTFKATPGSSNSPDRESPGGQNRRPVSGKTCPTSSPDRESHVGKKQPPLSARTRSAQTQDRKQELNSKENMKKLADYCKVQTEKHAHALHQPHNTVDLQDVGKDLLERELEENKAELEMYKGMNENLTQEITPLRSENKSLNEDIQRLSDREQSKEEWENLRTELIKIHEKERAQLLETIDRLNVEKDNLLKRDRELSTKEVEQVRNKMKEEHEKETTQLFKRIDSLNKEKEDLLKSKMERDEKQSFPVTSTDSLVPQNILVATGRAKRMESNPADTNNELEKMKTSQLELEQAYTDLKVECKVQADRHANEKEQLLNTIKNIEEEKEKFLKREREQSTNELENLRKDLNKSHEKELAQLLENIDHLNVEKDNLLKRDRELSTKDVEQVRNKMKEKHEKKTDQLLKQIENLNKEKEVLLKRLSTIASDRLTHENPNIADLSDENRPTKLQEVYGELYDNEWTDAFEELKTHMNISEKDAIMILLKIIMNSFHNCREITWSRYEKLVNVASSIYIEKKTPIRCTEKTSAHDTKKPEEANMTATSTASVHSCNEMEVPKHNETSVDQRNRDEKMESRTEKIGLTSAKSVQSSKDKAKCSIELNVGIMHAIKNIWKTTSFELKGISAESIFSVVATNLDIPLESMPNTSKYLKSCVDLCWRMSVQEMPLHLEAIDEIDVKAQKKFDKDKFRHFTKSGEKVDYVVWPALYRYEGGPLILKGIAQGC